MNEEKISFITVVDVWEKKKSKIMELETVKKSLTNVET